MSWHVIKRNIKHWFQRRTRGWSDDETYNLNYQFIKWINVRFKKYKELANKRVDLGYHKFTYQGKEYTQLELIEREIYLTEELLGDDFWSFDTIKITKTKEMVEEVFDIFKLIFFTMWW